VVFGLALAVAGMLLGLQQFAMAAFGSLENSF
jgi:hypothetical protein